MVQLEHSQIVFCNEDILKLPKFTNEDILKLPKFTNEDINVKFPTHCKACIDHF